MSNPIFNAQLLGEDEIKKMIQHFTNLAITAETSIKKIQGEAAKLGETLKATNVTQSEQRETIKKSAKEADQMEKALSKYNESLSDNQVKIAAVKNAQRTLNQLNKAEAKLLAAKKGSYNALSAQYSINKIKLNQMSAAERNATKSGQELEKQTKEIYEEMKTLQEATGKHTLSVGDYGKAFGGLGAGIDGAISKMKAFIANPIGLVIAAIAGAFVLLKNAMSRSEEGQDRLNKILRIGGAVLDAVMDVLTELAIALFDGIPQVLKRSAVRFKLWFSILESGFLKVRIAVNNFFGDTEEATQLSAELKTVQQNIADLKTEADDLTKQIGESFSGLTKSVVGFGDAVTDNIDKAGKLADLEAARNKAERRYIIENANLAKQAAALRAVAEDTKKTAAEQSIQALERAFALEEKALQNEISLAKVRTDIKKKEAALAANDIAANKEIAESEAAIINAQTALEQKRIEKGRLLNTFRLEAFKQENDRQKDRLEILKTTNEIEASELEKIVENEKRSVTQRIAAVEELEQKRLDVARKAFDIEKAALDKELELKLISDKDYAIAKELLIAKNNSLFSKSADQTIKDLERIGKSIYKELVEPIEILTPQIEDGATKALNFAKKLTEDALKEKPKGNWLMNMLGVSIDDQEAFKQSINTALGFAKQQLSNFLAERVRIADQNVAQTQREVDAANASISNAQNALQVELQRNEQGLASRVDTAEQDLQLANNQAAEAKRRNDKALKDQEKAQKAQRRLQSVEQAGNLITASAKIWGNLGFPLALPALAVMWGSFAAAKIQAAKLTKQEFSEGGLEVLGGGSHASGNDTFLFQNDKKAGYGQSGEAVAVINRRNTNKYKSLLPDIINSLNTGTFENKFLKATQSASQIPFFSINNNNTDTSKMEDHLAAIRNQNESKYFTDGKGRTIQVYKNVTTTHAN